MSKWGSDDGPSTQRRKSEQNFGVSKYSTDSVKNAFSKKFNIGKKTEDKPSKEG